MRGTKQSNCMEHRGFLPNKTTLSTIKLEINIKRANEQNNNHSLNQHNITEQRITIRLDEKSVSLLMKKSQPVSDIQMN